MSLYLVPEKYDFIPNHSDITRSKKYLNEVLVASEIECWESDEAQVIGLLIYGSQQITCPICKKISNFENPAAFGEMLTVQSAETIEFKMDCCGKAVNLAQIDLSPNTKFSRFGIHVLSDDRLSDENLTLISDILGHKMMVIFQDEDE
jgi:hypothetical protein